MKWWEKICAQCGSCCHEKVRLSKNRYLYYENIKCPHLRDDGSCEVYHERFCVSPSCKKMTLLRAMTATWLPPDCAYVEWAKRHHIRFAPECEWVVSLDEELD